MINDRKKPSEPLSHRERSEHLCHESGGWDSQATQDEELKALLESWADVKPTSALDHRVMAAYSKHCAHTPFWKRIIAGSFRVPVPVAAAVVLFLVVSASFVFRANRALKGDVILPAVTTARPLVIEVSVIQEKIVTRKVYVERNSFRENRTRNQTLAKDAGKVSAPSPKPDYGSQYFTHTDLKGFEPVKEINSRVLGRVNENEN